MKIDKETILKLDRPGPRYTSYPTAPEWSNGVSADTYREQLSNFGNTDKTLSLYAHIPFCETLCYFCGCTMNIRPQEEKHGDEFIGFISKEIDQIARLIGRRKTVRQLHWGGGTPSFLSEDQMIRLFDKIKSVFDIDPTGEIAIEVDPRRISESKVKTIRDLGFNRISIGLQDFDERVQREVNRVQPFSLVEQFHQWCRKYQFSSVNFDLIYGLPGQTLQSFTKTVEQVIALRPDRIALYSFAYVPWLKKHQNKLKADLLPAAEEKLEIFLKARELFLQNGYEAIAMDHFALKNDDLAKAFRDGKLYRNFMGYTVKPADEYIGLGPSAIGFLENTFFQNYKTIPEYYRFLKQDELPVERGKVLSQDDQIRKWVIGSLMCHFQLNKDSFFQMFHKNFDDYFVDEQKHIQECQNNRLLTGDAQNLVVTDLGKIFIRNICMGFDWYLRQHQVTQKFSRTV